MGKWIYRDADQHKCSKPGGDFKTRAGDIWECDCGLQYRVVSCRGNGDQRDYYYTVTWEPMPKANPDPRDSRPYGGIFAPGTK